MEETVESSGFDALVSQLVGPLSGAGRGVCAVLPSAWVARIEARVIDMKSVRPDPTAVKLARAYGLEPKRVTIALAQGRGLGPSMPGRLVVRCTAGNLFDGGIVFEGDEALPLPKTPQAWLEGLCAALEASLGWAPDLALTGPSEAGPVATIVARCGAGAPTPERWRAPASGTDKPMIFEAGFRQADL